MNDTVMRVQQALRDVANNLNATARSRSGGEYEPRPMIEADVEHAIAEALNNVVDALTETS